MNSKKTKCASQVGARRVLIMSFIRRAAVYGLITAVMCLLPAVVYPEFTQPMDTWARWANRGEKFPDDSYPESYPVGYLPPGMVVAKVVFGVCVLPTARLFEWGDHKTTYGFTAAALFGGPRGSFHYEPPFLVAALDWWKYGVPFWLVIIVGVGECARLLWRRVAGYLTNRAQVDATRRGVTDRAQ